MAAIYRDSLNQGLRFSSGGREFMLGNRINGYRHFLFRKDTYEDGVVYWNQIDEFRFSPDVDREAFGSNMN